MKNMMRETKNDDARRRRALRGFIATLAAAMAISIASCVNVAKNGNGDVLAERGLSAPELNAAAKSALKWLSAKGSALVVMDLQKAYMPIVRQQYVFENVRRLVEAAQKAGALVIWVYNEDGSIREGSPVFELAPPFVPAPEHLKVVKKSSSAFSGTGLEELLDEREIGRVVFCGLASNYCVRASVESSLASGYRTVVAEDAHSVISGGGSMATVDSMNDQWRKTLGIEVVATAAVQFLPPSVATRGLGAEDWPMSEKFRSFLDESYRSLLARSPETVTQAGLSAWAGQDDTALDGLSSVYLEETRRLEREALKALDAYDRSGMSAGDKLSADAYRRSLADSVALQEFAEMDYLVNPTVFGIAYSSESLFSAIQPVTTLAGARAYIARLAALGAKIDEGAAALKRRANKKAIAPRAVLEAALPAIRDVAGSSSGESVFYEALDEKLSAIDSIDEGEREALLLDAEKIITSGVISAYGRLAAEVERSIAKAPTEIGIWKLPGGKKYYEALLRAKTTSELSPDQIHEMGLQALKRIHAEIVAVGERSGTLSGKTPASLVEEAFRGGMGPDQALAGYTKLLRATEASVRQYFPLYPAAPVEIRTAPQGGYYSPGPVDGSFPGVFYVARGNGANKAGMPTLLYHETVPGHHLQIAIAHELDLPVARKLMYFEAYVEGWALYAERFMEETGVYENDPAGNIGRLQAEAFRAARLVVDTGIHAKRWSFEKAVDFMVDQGLMNRRAAQWEVLRYASIPGQATSYYVGFLRFLELRERAKNELGEAFNVGAFHRTVLSCGAVPFDVLSAVVDRYIREAKEE